MREFFACEKISFAFAVPLLRRFLLSVTGVLGGGTWVSEVSSDLRIGLFVSAEVAIPSVRSFGWEGNVESPVGLSVLLRGVVWSKSPSFSFFEPNILPRKPPWVEDLRSVVPASLITFREAAESECKARSGPQVACQINRMT